MIKKSLPKLIIYFSLISFSAFSQNNKSNQLDKSVLLDEKDKVSTVFKDMVVVQRKAKEKSKKILTNIYGSFDFSDGPNTMYALNTDIGYSINDFWEVYLNLVPYFLVQDRDIVDKVGSLTLLGGDKAKITYAKPKYQYGINLLWVPAYGKDSWGPYSIIRSDTFFKFSIGQISYEGSESGLRYAAMVGKTFFIKDQFNFRISTGLVNAQTIVDNVKKSSMMAAIEAGLVFYF